MIIHRVDLLLSGDAERLSTVGCMGVGKIRSTSCRKARSSARTVAIKNLVSGRYAPPPVGFSSPCSASALGVIHVC